MATPALAGEDAVRRGKLLFDRPWRVPAGQDQVGPLFNAQACAECHPGGDAGRRDGPALVLLTGGDPLLGRQIQPLSVGGVAAEAVPKRPLAARLAPGLRGIGTLAAIPADIIARAADPADADGDGVSGRLGLGRFGAKAEHVTLAAAVEAALATDMGLATPSHPEPAGDCTAAQRECRAAASGGTPVPARDIERLVAYVAALLPRPSQAPGDHEVGRGLLETAGCAACHGGPYTIPTDAAVTGVPFQPVAPYTDLLLHDLGPGLADPFPSPGAAAGEWRTAPLWGLRSRAAFLHDGRAASLREAILWHDGEGAASRRRFLALSEEEQAALLTFLAAL